MLIYEVNIEVEEAEKFKFAGWLQEHIPKMLNFEGFKAAHWYFRSPEDEGIKDSTRALWTIHYLVVDRKSLDDYVNNHAQQMRQEAKDKFGDKFAITRRVLNLLSVAGFQYEQAPAAESKP